MKLTRRTILKGGVAAISAVLLPINNKSFAVVLSTQKNPPKESFEELNDWVWIDRNNRIVLGVTQAECGQGIYTGMAQVIAAEMDANWQDITVQFVQKRDAYRHEGGGVKFSQFVGASTSMNSFYQRLRVAGAQARELFLTAGAKYFKVPIEDCLTENSHVIHQKTGKKVAYGQLLDFIENIELNPKPQLKNNSENSQSIEGKKIKRVDTPAKVDGSAIFGIDVDVPNMLIGVPWMVPSYTGKIVKINNEEAIKAMPGVVDLVLTRHLNSENMKGLDKNNDINTIIVVAESFWQAKQAADSLDVEYDLGSAANTSTKTIDADNQARIARDDLIEVINRGQAKQKIAEAKKDSDNYHEAAYEMPYLTHGTMEPCNTTCHVRDGEVEVWGPIQGPDLVRTVLGSMFKIPSDDVILHNTYLGGSFGRKYVPDAAIHAALASKATGRPVKVIYPRDIDIRHGFYRPGQIAQFQAVLDEEGYPDALMMKSAGQSLYWQMHRDKVEKTGWDETMVECVYNTIYDLPSLHIEMGHDTQPLALSYMRGVGSMSNLFFYESFINELAFKAGIDEYEYRRRLLKDQPLALAVLDKLAEVSDWNKPLPDNCYRGMAFNNWVGRDRAFVTPVGLVLELMYQEEQAKITQVTCVLDCGHVINPSLVEANIDGGVGFALTGTLKSKLHMKNGAIVEDNFNNYQLLRMAEMPPVKVVTINSQQRSPQGVGEMSSAVVAPALAAALHKATGKFYRKTPITNIVFA